MKNIEEIRADFPILSRKVYDKPLVYFDNGATTQKPKVVIDALTEVYSSYNANIHRGVHLLSDLSSEAYENAREKVRSFINAGKEGGDNFYFRNHRFNKWRCLFFRGTIYQGMEMK